MDQIRNWKDGQWTRFGVLADSKHLYEPLRVNNKKLDRMLSSFYSAVNYALDEVCPKIPVSKNSKSFKWYTEEHREISERVNKAYILSRKSHRNEDFEAYKNELSIYKRRCRRDRNKSWNRFMECTKDVNEMAKLNRIIQGGERNNVNVFDKEDGTCTEPGKDTCLLYTSPSPRD